MIGDRVVFRYKPMLGRSSPTATIGLYLSETWRRIDAYVDSGATHSIVHVPSFTPISLKTWGSIFDEANGFWSRPATGV